MDDPRLSRGQASAHSPEQIHLTLAGLGVMAVSWVTHPEVRVVAWAGGVLTTQLPQSGWRGVCAGPGCTWKHLACHNGRNKVAPLVLPACSVWRVMCMRVREVDPTFF